MRVFYAVSTHNPGDTFSGRVSRAIDRIDVTFDESNSVSNAGLLLVATLTQRLGLEAVIDATVRLFGKVGGARPGRKVLTLVHAMIAGATHIDHADVLRAGSTASVLGHRVMAPSTLGTFLRSFTFGHVRQLEAVVGRVLAMAWGLGAGPGVKPLTIDIDSTICEVEGKHKHDAAFGYTHVLGYHPLHAAPGRRASRLHGHRGEPDVGVHQHGRQRQRAVLLHGRERRNGHHHRHGRFPGRHGDEDLGAHRDHDDGCADDDGCAESAHHAA